MTVSGELTADSVVRMIAQLHDAARTDTTDTTDAELIDRIAALETLKSVASALQAHCTAAFARSRETKLAASASERRRQDARRDTGAQIGLARRVSPRVGSRLVGLATVLDSEMPCLRDALRAGVIDEYQATLVAGETAMLSLEHRRQVDTELADRFGTMTAEQAKQAAARIGYRLDAGQAVARTRKAESERCVTIRKAPDTMAYVTALLPVAAGVAAWAALHHHAVVAKALGDERGKGAVMADEFVARLLDTRAQNSPAPTAFSAPSHPTLAAVPGNNRRSDRTTDTSTTKEPTGPALVSSGSDTGATVSATDSIGGSDQVSLSTEFNSAHAPIDIRARAAGSGAATATATATATEGAASLSDGLASVPAGIGVEIHLVMTDRTLFDGDTEPAILSGYGPIPAPLARHLARGADRQTTTWIRRIYTDPHTGALTGADPRRRLFTHTARQFLITRDQVCRTPWCGAPIRHADHTRPFADGGATDLTNGGGRCAACNQIKESPGWVTAPAPDGTITTITPTGHRYDSSPPPPPRSGKWAETVGTVDISAESMSAARAS